MGVHAHVMIDARARTRGCVVVGAWVRPWVGVVVWAWAKAWVRGGVVVWWCGWTHVPELPRTRAPTWVGAHPRIRQAECRMPRDLAPWPRMRPMGCCQWRSKTFRWGWWYECAREISPENALKDCVARADGCRMTTPTTKEDHMNVNADYTRGENDGIWGTYANPTHSDDYERGHVVGSAMRAVKMRAAVAAGLSK